MFTFLSFVEKMNNNWLLSSLFLTLSSMAPAQDIYTVTVKNKSDLQLTAQPVIVDLRNEDLPIVTSAIVQLSGGHTSLSEPQEEVPCQLDDLDGDKRFDELCFLTKYLHETSGIIFKILPFECFAELVIVDSFAHKLPCKLNYVK